MDGENASIGFKKKEKNASLIFAVLDQTTKQAPKCEKGKPEQSGLLPGDARRRVRVAIRRQNLVDNVLLDKVQRTPGSGVVGVGDAARA
jgi:hypothetical protein